MRDERRFLQITLSRASDFLIRLFLPSVSTVLFQEWYLPLLEGPSTTTFWHWLIQPLLRSTWLNKPSQAPFDNSIILFRYAQFFTNSCTAYSFIWSSSTHAPEYASFIPLEFVNLSLSQIYSLDNSSTLVDFVPIDDWHNQIDYLIKIKENKFSTIAGLLIIENISGWAKKWLNWWIHKYELVKGYTLMDYIVWLHSSTMCNYRDMLGLYSHFRIH